MEQLFVVYITCATETEAQNIIDALLKDRLVACVNKIPKVFSFFHWRGSIEKETEVLLVAKTRQIRLQQLFRTVKHLHSYETPEIIACPIFAAPEDYKTWVLEETSKDKEV